jgi:hypothetical protein
MTPAEKHIEIVNDTNVIDEAFEDIPISITVLHFTTMTPFNIDIFPSLDRFSNLRTIYFINITGIRILPNLNHMKYLKYLNIQGCSIETLETIPSLIHLVLKNNNRLNMYTLPESIGVLECIGQNMGDFTIPTNNIMTTLHQCVVSSVTNIAICHEYINEHPTYIFDMTDCISPYQTYIDEKSRQLEIPEIYTNGRCHSQSIQLLPYIIDIVVNRELLLDFVNNMICVRNSTVQHKTPLELEDIHTVFVLGSNYPRRMMEYI